MQALYSIEVGSCTVEEALEHVRDEATWAPVAYSYVKELVEGVTERLQEIDALIVPLLSKGWDWSRSSAVTRNILRIAVYELYHRPGMPPAATINEAVYMAKTFGQEEEGRFVNGLLGNLLPNSPKANWDPSMTEPVPEMPDYRPDPAPTASETETVEEGSEEFEAFSKLGRWIVRTPQPKDNE